MKASQAREMSQKVLEDRLTKVVECGVRGRKAVMGVLLTDWFYDDIKEILEYRDFENIVVEEFDGYKKVTFRW